MCIRDRGWFLVASTALFGVCISHIFFYVALLRLGASITSSFQMLSPFLTSIVAALYLGEKMRGGAWAWVAGLSLVIGGLCLLWAQESLAEDDTLDKAESSAQDPQSRSSGEGSSPASG